MRTRRGGVGWAGGEAPGVASRSAWSSMAWISEGVPRASSRSACAWVAAQTASSRELSSWISRWRACISRVRSVCRQLEEPLEAADLLGELLAQAGRVVDQVGGAVPPGHGRPDLGDGPLLGLRPRPRRRAGARPRAGPPGACRCSRSGRGVTQIRPTYWMPASSIAYCGPRTGVGMRSPLARLTAACGPGDLGLRGADVGAIGQRRLRPSPARRPAGCRRAG